MIRPPLALAVALLAVAAGCGPLPPEGPGRALYTDLRAVVVHEARTDWVVDRVELEQIAPRVLQSGCQVAPEQRLALRAWVRDALQAAGGPAAASYARSQDLSAVQDQLVLERVAASLDYLDAHQADCPFWLPPDPDFAGVQGDADHFVLMVETMGGGQVVLRDGEATLGGAGGGRILPGYGLNSRLTLAAGLGLGGASTFPKDANGNRTVKPAWAFDVPVLLRVHAGTWRFDTELAATARAPFETPDSLRYGARIAQALGVTTPRVAGVMPYVMLWVGHEWLPAMNGEDAVQIMRAGTRVGINWAP